MTHRPLPLRAVMFAALLLAPLAALAQSGAWPDAPARIVVPYRPGTGPDQLARELSDRLGKRSGQALVVENRDGANGSIGAAAVAKAAGDGRTLLLMDSVALPINTVLIKQVPFDWRKELKAVTPVADVELFLYTGTKRDFRSIDDVIRFAKANPGVLNFGVVGTGSVSHLSVERLMAQQNVRFTRINYNGMDQVVPALLSGDIDLFVLGPAAFGGHVAKGTVRVLLNGSERRGTTFPEAPTLKEAGLPPGLFVGTRFTLFAPGATPDALVARINQASVSILQQPEMREKFLKAGLNVVSGDAATEAKRLEEVAGPVETLVRSLKLSND